MNLWIYLIFCMMIFLLDWYPFSVSLTSEYWGLLQLYLLHFVIRLMVPNLETHHVKLIFINLEWVHDLSRVQFTNPLLLCLKNTELDHLVARLETCRITNCWSWSSDIWYCFKTSSTSIPCSNYSPSSTNNYSIFSFVINTPGWSI